MAEYNNNDVAMGWDDTIEMIVSLFFFLKVHTILRF